MKYLMIMIFFFLNLLKSIKLWVMGIKVVIFDCVIVFKFEVEVDV